MQGLEWLDGAFGNVRCANCGAAYEQGSVSVVGNRDDYWFVRCVCESCGTQGLGVVIVKEVTVAATPAAPDAIAVDDVLEAHELLGEYQGGVAGLFDAQPRHADR